MNLAANQAMYPQTAAHLPYANGAIIQNHLQQPASIVRKFFYFIKNNYYIYQASYPHIGQTGPGPSTLVFNQAGQAFSIPLHAAHLQQISQATGTTMYGPDGTQYYQPVTQITAQPTGPKITRTDRLEVCFSKERNFSLIIPTIFF